MGLIVQKLTISFCFFLIFYYVLALTMPPPLLPESPPLDVSSLPVSTINPISPPSEEVKNEQLKWPDTIDLTENAQNVLASSTGKNVDFFKQVEVPIGVITTTLVQLIKTREEAYEKFFELEASLDNFLQTTGFNKGIIQEIMNPLITKE